MSDLFKNQVLAIYPDAIVVEDTDCNNRVYTTVEANDSRFVVVQMQNVIAEEKPYQTSYMNLLDGEDFVNWIGGWQKTIDNAWESAWNLISAAMLQKLEK